MNFFTKEPLMLQEARTAGKGHGWPGELLIFLPVALVAMVMEALPSLLYTILSEPAFFQNAAEEISRGNTLRITAPYWLGLPSTALSALTVILICRWFQNRRLSSLGFHRRGALREYGIGILMGFVMITASVGGGLLTGAYRLSISSVGLGTLLLSMLGWMIQGLSEEVLCRGYLMVSIARKNPLWLAILLSSAVFTLLHSGNPGVGPLAYINLFLFGTVCAVYMLRRGSIWGSCAAHSFWNFFQGNVYGVSVSGQEVNASLLRADAVGPALWTGGEFGIEASLCVTIVELGALLILLFAVPSREA